jgi:hypothetical protein
MPERGEAIRDLSQALLELPWRQRLRSLQQILRLVAKFGHLTKTHHPARTLEGVQLPANLGRSILALIHRADQLVESLDPVSRFLEEEGVEIVVVSQILVQFRRFTSIPRVPTIAPAASWTATAMVKHGSPVRSES